MSQYSQEQVYEAMRRADAAGDGEAVRALAAALKAGASKQQINDIAAQQNVAVDQAALDANIAARDAGKPTNTFLPPAAQAVVSDSVGVVQGAVGGAYDFPMQVAGKISQGVNYLLTEPPAAVLNALGATDAADWLRKAGRGVREGQQATADLLSVSNALERMSPTMEGRENQRFAGQLIGSLAVPFGPKGKPPVAAPKLPVRNPATEIVSEGQKAGVRVLTSDVRQPRGFTGKVARAMGERIPYAGTGAVRVKQNKERIAAVGDLAREFGADTGEDFVKGVADDFAKTRGDTIKKLKGAKDAVLAGVTAPFTTAPATIRAIGEQVRKLKGIDAQEYAPVIERLQRFADQLTSGKTLEQVEGQRKLLGELFADQSLAKIKGEGQKAVNAIYGPLRDDMGAFIRANGGDFGKWQGANKKLSEMAGELGNATFKGTLNAVGTSPEDVARLLFSRKASDVARLYGNLSEPGKSKARAAIIFRAVEKATDGGVVSPQKFASEIERLAKPVGIVFEGADKARVEGLSKLLKATQQASVAAAAPPTGVQSSQFISGAVTADLLGTAGGAVTVTALAGLAARAYESATVRNLLIGLGKTRPGTPQEASFIQRIEKAMAGQSGINPPSALNDNVGQLAAASAGNNEENRQN